MRQTMPVDYALLLLLATLWGGSYTFIKLGVATIPPLTLIAGRTLIAGCLLLLVLRLRGLALPSDPRLWRQFTVQTLLNSAIPFTLIAWAELHIEAGLAAILNATTPIFAFLITALITRHEPATPRKALGVAAGLAGACLVIGIDALAGVGANINAQLAVLLASLLYGMASVYGKTFSGMDPLLPATGSLLAGAAMLVPASLLIDRPWTLSPSATSVMALIGLAVFSTALAFVIYFRLLASLGSVGVTAQGYLRLLIGVAIGVVFLGEQLTSSALAGLVFILAGVVLMTAPARR